MKKLKEWIEVILIVALLLGFFLSFGWFEVWRFQISHPGAPWWGFILHN
jgi:hypothetical protein